VIGKIMRRLGTWMPSAGLLGTTTGIILTVIAAVAGLAALVLPAFWAASPPDIRRLKAPRRPGKVNGVMPAGDQCSVTPRRGDNWQQYLSAFGWSRRQAAAGRTPRPDVAVGAGYHLQVHLVPTVPAGVRQPVCGHPVDGDHCAVEDRWACPALLASRAAAGMRTRIAHA